MVDMNFVSMKNLSKEIRCWKTITTIEVFHVNTDLTLQWIDETSTLTRELFVVLWMETIPFLKCRKLIGSRTTLIGEYIEKKEKDENEQRQ